MKPLTLPQFYEIVEFAQKYHKFGQLRESSRSEFPGIPSYGFQIKYIDSTYDSRDAVVRGITFWFGIDGVKFSDNHFMPFFRPQPKGWKFNNLYDLCMAYLKGEFNPKEEFLVSLNKTTSSELLGL